MKTNLVILSAMLAAGVQQAWALDLPLALKLRTQAGFTTEHGMRNGFGAGLNAAYKMGPGYLNAELGFQYYSGKQYRQPINPANPFGLTEQVAVDSRKNSNTGLTLRAAWHQDIIKNLAWQAGLCLASLKNHHESIGNFGLSGEYGGWAVAIDKTSTTLSPYAGVRWDINDVGALELNLLLQSSKVTTLEPVYNTADGTPSGQRVTYAQSTKNLTKPKLEIGYAFKF